MLGLRWRNRMIAWWVEAFMDWTRAELSVLG